MRPLTDDLLPGRVVFGPGTVRQIPAEVGSLGGRKVLLIADGLAKSDADVIEKELGDGVVARIGEISHTCRSRTSTLRVRSPTSRVQTPWSRWAEVGPRWCPQRESC